MIDGLLNDEALFLGAAFAHIHAYRERERLDRIARSNREAVELFLRRNPEWTLHLLGLKRGELGFAPVIACDGGVGA